MLKNLLLSPITSLILFLLGVAVDIVCGIPGVGVARLLPLIPSVLHVAYITWRGKS